MLKIFVCAYEDNLRAFGRCRLKDSHAVAKGLQVCERKFERFSNWFPIGIVLNQWVTIKRLIELHCEHAKHGVGDKNWKYCCVLSLTVTIKAECYSTIYT